MRLSFKNNRLTFEDWPTIRVEVIALRAFEELSRRDNLTDGWVDVVFDWNWPKR